MEIMPVWHVAALMAVPFLVAVISLKKIILDPMWDYLEERRTATDGARDEIAALQDQIAQKITELDKRLESARAEAADIRAKHRSEAGKKADGIVHEARVQAEAKIGAAVTEIRGNADKARGELEPMTRALGNQIAGRVLGRELAAG